METNRMLSLAMLAMTLASSPPCTRTPLARPGDAYENAQSEDHLDVGYDEWNGKTTP